MTTPARTPADRRLWIGLAIAAIVIALVVGALLGSRGGDGGNAGVAPTQAPQSSAATEAATPDGPPLSVLARRADGDPHAFGALDAPIVMIEYADFTCKYCGAFAENSLPELVRDYVDSGKVRLEWRDAPVLSEHSVTTAIAGRAAAAQGKFWPFYEAMYAHTYAGDGDYSNERLTQLAAGIEGLDVAAFTAALTDPALRAAVEAEGAETASLGITGTPTFVIGDAALVGAQPTEVFRQTLDAELAKVGA